ncbi:glycoside hydrolase [Cercophora scortea]|uniref:Glycoside hydrolase n=1 Tax=Cercophora scortea TaxID=314031 RepID=A0AAE0IVB8_9PEZI|nr:glycoside hydrolase [Cercophora scortea]
MSLFSKIKDRKNKWAAEKSGRKVFAHYMVGLTHNQSFAQWNHDIVTAKECGIDGFALNMGPSDSWTYDQLHLAYQAAEQAGDFVLFPSFDMACGMWQVDQVVGLINLYKQSPAQMAVDGKPFVSTFEGPDWADNWASVRHQTGDIFLVPAWSSLGPYGVGKRLDIIDGAFSWDAWPKAGQTHMSAHEDRIYKECLDGKKYMMGVSPYFYTKLPHWNKNWYSSSESLWHDRWQQVLEIMPDYVQIITWNDFGESSYICDTVPAQIVHGAHKYVNDYPHSAFRAVLPFLIAAYKAGSSKVDLPGDDTAIAWYRKTPARAAHDGDTKWGQGGSQSAAEGARDVISVMAVTKGSTSVAVTIGGQQMSFKTRNKASVDYFEMPFDNGTTGPVTISLNGRTTYGPEVTCDCDKVIFNAVVIQV